MMIIMKNKKCDNDANTSMIVSNFYDKDEYDRKIDNDDVVDDYDNFYNTNTNTNTNIDG